MQKEDIQKVLSGLSDNEEFMQKYRQAATEEEKAKLLSGVIGDYPGATQELNEEELENVSGGTDRFYRVMAVCSQCGWRSSVGSPNYIFDLGIEHIDNSPLCYSIQLVAI